MDASTRLYTRLGEIPEDPNDPESLAELLVCAFGAFERYYVCWKTQAGEYKQDGYDLPPALKDWLYPTDGTTRDYATLQVVFGRGEEYFASDKNGKLEYKEPEVKKQNEDEEKIDKPVLRRARTVSFLRPLSDVSARSDTVMAESAESRRSSTASSRRASRPPSLSYSRTSSAASISSELIDLPKLSLPARVNQPSRIPPWEALESIATVGDPSIFSTKRSSRSFEQPVVESISEEVVRYTSAHDQHEASNTSLNQNADFQVPEGYMLVPINPTTPNEHTVCVCKRHSQASKNSYIDTSTQTEEEVTTQPRKTLRIDTCASASQWSAVGYSAVDQNLPSPVHEILPADNPVFMGRMMNYFSKPGYQLGDSLMSGYQVVEPMYEYQDAFGDEVLHFR